MNLGPLSTLDLEKRKTTKPKKISNDVMLVKYSVTVNFPNLWLI